MRPHRKSASAVLTKISHMASRQSQENIPKEMDKS